MFLGNAYADDDTIIIQETGESPVAPESSAYSGLTSLVPMLLIFIVFYFFLIRPQEKRRREKEGLVSSVKKGEEVITTGGILGVVAKINDNDGIIELEIAENIRIKILKSSIADITSRNKKEDSDKSKKAKGNK